MRNSERLRIILVRCLPRRVVMLIADTRSLSPHSPNEVRRVRDAGVMKDEIGEQKAITRAPAGRAAGGARSCLCGTDPSARDLRALCCRGTLSGASRSPPVCV